MKITGKEKDHILPSQTLEAYYCNGAGAPHRELACSCGEIEIAMSPKKTIFRGPLTADQKLAFYFRNLEHFILFKCRQKEI